MNAFEKIVCLLFLTLLLLIICSLVDDAEAKTFEPVRQCYPFDRSYTYIWCEPDYALYNQYGYEVLTAEWLNNQYVGNAEMRQNALSWYNQIVMAKQFFNEESTREFYSGRT